MKKAQKKKAKDSKETEKNPGRMSLNLVAQIKPEGGIKIVGNVKAEGITRAQLLDVLEHLIDRILDDGVDGENGIIRLLLAARLVTKVGK